MGQKSSPLKFSPVFLATVWNFNLNFTDLFIKTFYILMPSKMWFCWKTTKLQTF